MILVDTCVLSEGSKPQGHPAVLQWLQANDYDLQISVVTLGEIRYGWLLMGEGRRAQWIGSWLEGVQHTFADRILPIDQKVMTRWAELRAKRQRSGRPLPLADGLIAATALQHGLALATRNVADFNDLGLRLHNPWQSI